nr:immunoglobulin light chain junction region [Macaca mulatta]MOW07896.1 immunoglobulin light chain junction region [Macaca mulatta]MOW08242.1 immunoglobulin light chain junction region [Macaca mulatta]MOW08525.1 immunoglobulin light chain junction region [Macaca mulatta]MOW08827.1 immunoglobulin light chain junction region [Macaca mulatta]
CQKYNSSPNSF